MEFFRDVSFSQRRLRFGVRQHESGALIKLTIAFLILVAAAGLAAPVPKPLQDDATLLEGVWVSKTFDGSNGRSECNAWMLIIKDGKMGLRASGWDGPEPPPAESPMTLDSTQSPKQFDVAWKGEKDPQRYIYKLSGDTLTICHAQQYQPRPT